MGLNTPPDPGDRDGDEDASGSDLARGPVSALMPDRPLRTYPALMSTEAEAVAWSRKGAQSGSLVVSAYQASPRGRSGLERPGLVEIDRGLGFSLILRPDLNAERRGWSYPATGLAIAQVLAERRPDATVATVWPDEVHMDGELVGSVGVQVDAGAERVRWTAISVLVSEGRPPRAELLRDLVERIEAAHGEPSDEVRQAYMQRCVTLGRRINARLLPMGATGPQIVGEAIEVVADGSIVIQSEEHEARVAVPPEDLGRVEEPDQTAQQTPEDSR